MTEFPPPPGPGQVPPPPPPPPYSTQPQPGAHHRPMYHIGKLPHVISGTLIAGSILGAFGAVRQLSLRNQARELLDSAADGATTTGDDLIAFSQRLARTNPFSGLSSLFLLVGAICTLVWMYRVVHNHRTLHRPTQWTPPWTIVGWLLPPFLHIIPFFVLKQMADNATPQRTTTNALPRWLLPAWLVCYNVIPLIVNITILIRAVPLVARLPNLSATQAGTLVPVVQAAQFGMVSVGNAVFTVIAAGLFSNIVLSISANHSTLIGKGR